MSYCRWSSDNFRSDVYVYEDASGGWTTHVAKRRLVLPAVPAIPFLWLDVFMGKRSMVHRMACRLWAWSNRLHLWTVRHFPHRVIGLSYDGKTMNHETPSECADFLERLRALGYYVPQPAIDQLREDAEEVV